MLLHPAIIKCFAIGAAYVAPFYLRGHQVRNHPSTIKYRMASTVATSLLAWVPLYHQVHKVSHSFRHTFRHPCLQAASRTCCVELPAYVRQISSTFVPQRTVVLQTASPKGLLLALLGVKAEGLLQAVIKSTLLTASLFAGPLLQLSLPDRTRREAVDPLQALRNLLVAPFTEEFCFRACMAPLFLLQVCTPLLCFQILRVQVGPEHSLKLVLACCKQRPSYLAARLAPPCAAVIGPEPAVLGQSITAWTPCSARVPRSGDQLGPNRLVRSSKIIEENLS